MTREEIAMKLCAIREGEAGWKCITDAGLEDYRTMADFVRGLLETELAEARKDGERLDWLSEQAKKSYTGVSIDSYRVTMEEEHWRGWGWRIMWHHHSERVNQSLRAAIDAARGTR